MVRAEGRDGYWFPALLAILIVVFPNHRLVPLWLGQRVAMGTLVTVVFPNHRLVPLWLGQSVAMGTGRRWLRGGVGSLGHPGGFQTARSVPPGIAFAGCVPSEPLLPAAGSSGTPSNPTNTQTINTIREHATNHVCIYK